MKKYPITKQIYYNNKLYNIVIRKYQLSKSIRIKPDYFNHGASVSIPLKVSYEYAKNYVLDNIDWLSNILEKNQYLNILKEQTIIIFNESYKIIFITNNNKMTIRIVENQILIEGIVKSHTILCKKLKMFFKNLIKFYIIQKIQNITNFLNVNYNKIIIRETKSKWGSCSSNRNLSFNWKLIFAPKEILDYVICHELCHLIHFNHSQLFWNLVKQIYPNVSYAKKWLKENGLILNRYTIQ